MNAEQGPRIDSEQAPWVYMKPDDAAIQVFREDGSSATWWGRPPVTVIVGDVWVTANAGERKLVRVPDGVEARRAAEADVLGVERG